MARTRQRRGFPCCLAGSGGERRTTRGAHVFDPLAGLRAPGDPEVDVFLQGGYLGTNVDAIAARSDVSKQTVYKDLGSKEALFIEIVASMTSDA